MNLVGGCVMGKAVKIAISLPSELLEAAEQARRQLGSKGRRARPGQYRATEERYHPSDAKPGSTAPPEWRDLPSRCGLYGARNRVVTHAEGQRGNEVRRRRTTRLAGRSFSDHPMMFVLILGTGGRPLGRYPL